MNTKDLLIRKQFPLGNLDCVLCSDHCLETSKHLFFECSFSRRCWFRLGFIWDLSLSVVDCIQELKQRANSKIFKEILIISCWSIWLQRNKVIFNQDSVSFNDWKVGFKEGFAAVILRARPSLRESFVNWLRDFG